MTNGSGPDHPTLDSRRGGQGRKPKGICDTPRPGCGAVGEQFVFGFSDLDDGGQARRAQARREEPQNELDREEGDQESKEGARRTAHPFPHRLLPLSVVSDDVSYGASGTVGSFRTLILGAAACTGTLRSINFEVQRFLGAE